MKATFLTFLLIPVFHYLGHSQSCLPNGIIFTTQAEVDNFSVNYPACTVIEGNVEIGGWEAITDLSGLSGLTRIDGNFGIFSATAIENLEGLNNLNSVGGNFYLSYNNALTDISALSSLQSIGGYFDISGNSTLSNLDGLEQLDSIGDWLAFNATDLTDLDGLSNLSFIGGDLLIFYNQVLASLAGLNNLNAIGGGLELLGNGMLADLNGLNNITTIGDRLLIYENNTLLNFTGLDKLRSVGGHFTVYNCGTFVNFQGLDSLRIIGDSLKVFSCPSLTDLSGMPRLDSIGDAFRLIGNSNLSHIGNFDKLAYIGSDFELENCPMLTQLTGLENLHAIGGNFLITDEVSNLQGLNQLQTIGGDYSVSSTLESFSGADNLNHIGGNFTILNNYNLTDFEGLNQLTTIDGDVWFNGMPSLANLSGLEYLTTVGGDLILDIQTGLTSVQELVSLTYIGGSLSVPYILESFEGLENLQTIGGNFNIEGDWYLENFGGLGSLRTIGGVFYVRVAPVLTSFHGLENLDSIGGFLRIEDNPLLNTLEGLDNLSYVGGPDLFVRNNPQLSDCSIYALCNALFVEDSNLFTIVNNNAPGCNGLEVKATCNTIPVEATVLIDTNGNCLPDSTDRPVEGVQVQLSGNGQMVLRPSNEAGRTQFQYFNSGSFTLYLPQYPSSNWAVCQDDILITPDTTFFQDTLKATFLLSPLQQECAALEVELGLPPSFRGCFSESDMQVTVKNTGNVLAEDVRLVLVKPVEMDVLATNPTISVQLGDTLIFDIGDLLPLTDFVVSLHVKTSCDFFLFEHTLCVEAFAYTFIPCHIAPPPASEIKLLSQCVADTTVRFTIKNVGDAPTQNPHEYTLIRNEDIVEVVSFSLNPQQSLTVDVPADGATYRMEATKRDDGSLTAIALESCGGLTPGLITAFWLDKGPPDYDYDCREVIGSFDPNQKTAIPAGVGPFHFLEANRSLEYTIEFQNTGTDTAFRVLLQDILSPHLDVNTFRPGFASHPYSWEIHGMDTLEVLFFPIMLPDSNVNEPASHGFFSFSIDQKPDLPDGTSLENTASIIFDFNPPIVTNTVQHTIGQLTVQVDETQAKGGFWEVWGNPTRDAAIFRAREYVEGAKRFDLYDAAGRQVYQTKFEGQQFEFQRGALGAGLYFFSIADAKGRLFTGKISIIE